jgi:hypothetical protein
MSFKKTSYIAIITTSVALSGCLHTPTPNENPQIPTTETISNESQVTTTQPTEPTSNEIDLRSLSSKFQFHITIPRDWDVEYVNEIDAINIYNPNAQDENNRENSQLFLRFFEANTFLTLQTVDIIERTPTTIHERDAVDYLIKKRPGIANFPHQPTWRNLEHRVLDIRKDETSPSLFYVFAKRPDLPNKQFEEIIQSITW